MAMQQVLAVGQVKENSVMEESRIINGNFAIDQRNAGNFVVVNGFNFFGLDRWIAGAQGGGIFRVQRSAGGGGADYRLWASVTTTDASLAASDWYAVGQKIEGVHLADMNFGLSYASAFTFAFNAFTNVAGTYPVAFRGGSPGMAYVKTIALPANVWTPIVMTIPGPTSGTWNFGNGTGLEVWISLANGSDYSTATPNTWQVANAYTTPGCTNLMATPAGELYMGYVRLYPGTIDYGPCRRLYADELRLCQRYFCKSYNAADIPGAITSVGSQGMVCYDTRAFFNGCALRWPQQMRATPTISLYSPVTGALNLWRANGAATDTVVNGTGEGETGVWLRNGSIVSAAEFVFGHWTASAEL